MVDVKELRKAAVCVYLAVPEEKVADDLSNKLKTAADEIESLRNELKQTQDTLEKVCKTFNIPL